MPQLMLTMAISVRLRLSVRMCLTTRSTR